MNTEQLTERERSYLVAARAQSDHRTAARWLRGEDIRGVIGQRLAAAAASLGITRGNAVHSEPPAAA